MKWRVDAVSIEDLVRDVIAGMGLFFENKGLQVTTTFGSPLPGISADRDRLVQVVTNLLSNAVKFTPAGGTIRVAVRQEPAPCSADRRRDLRYGHGHPGRGPGADIRKVPAVGRRAHRRDRRDRARSRDSPPDRRIPRRPDLGREHATAKGACSPSRCRWPEEKVLPCRRKRDRDPSRSARKGLFVPLYALFFIRLRLY